MIENIASQYIIIYCTVPNRETADSLADKLVARKLCACVSIIPQTESVYWWEGKVQKQQELLLVMKSRAALQNHIIALIKENHPYETPEIIWVPVGGGSKKYLDWISNSTSLAM